MARLTVEQKWWIDPRRTFLMDLVSKPTFVDGLMIQVWRMAQEYWGHGELIPWRVFSKFPEAQKIIDSDLAELRSGPQLESSSLPALPQDTSSTFVYVRGSKDFFTWILDVREKRSLGGKISAQRPRDSKGRLLKIDDEISSSDPASVQLASSLAPAPSSLVHVSGSGSGSYNNKTNISISDEMLESELIGPPENSPREYPEEFEKIWEFYPKKKNKKAAYKGYRSKVVAKTQQRAFKQALEAYLEECQTENKPLKFYKDLGTFTNCFEDYLETNSNGPPKIKPLTPEEIQQQIDAELKLAGVSDDIP